MRWIVASVALVGCISSSCYSYSLYSTPNLSKATLGVAPLNVPANGQASSYVTYVLHDLSGAALANLSVDVASNIGTVSPSSAVTDANGRVNFTILSAQGGVAQITASVHYVDQVWPLSLKGSVNFFSPAPGTSNGVAAGSSLNAGVSTSPGYTGTVHFTSTDPNATLPPDYTFTVADNGFKIFPNGIILRTPGVQTVTATEVGTGDVVFQETFNVVASTGDTGTVGTGGSSGPPAASLQLTGLPDMVAAGTQSSVVVTALDANGNTATGYLGTVHFSSSDQHATLPANYVFDANDGGVHYFVDGVALGTVGTQSVTVSDSGIGTVSGSQSGIQVLAGSTASLLVSGFPSTSVAGSLHSLTVQAVDVYGNPTPSYTGNVGLISTDPQAALPAAQALSSGSALFTNVSLRTVGVRSVTAVSSTDSSITGSETDIAVTANAPVVLALSLNANTIAGASMSATATAQDNFGNTVTDYSGVLHFTCTDGQATLPPDSTISNGYEAFSSAIALRTAGVQTIEANDPATGLTGDFNVTVSPGAANSSNSSLTINPNGVPADDINVGTVWVVARDAYGNTVPGQAVTLSADKGTLNNTSGSADATGSFQTALKSSVVGTSTVTATLGSASVSGSTKFIQPITFGTPNDYQDYFTGSTDYPRYITSSDVNGDGHIDIISTTPWGSGVTINFGKGNGTFANPNNYNLGDDPWMIAAADLNGDGHPDLAYTSNHNMTVMLNNGAGVFSSVASYTITSSQGFGVAIGDLNGDGHKDVAIAGPASYIGVFINKGNGQMNAMATYTTTNEGAPNGTGRSDIAIGDVNEDGYPDLVESVGDPSGIYVFLNKGNGTFNAYTSYSASCDGIDVALADVNGDGHLDALTTNSQSTATILFGNGKGAFPTTTTYGIGEWPCSYAIDDFNADGSTDLVLASFSNALVYGLANLGDGVYGPLSPYGYTSMQNPNDLPWQITTADYNEDGKPDVAVSTSFALFSVMLNTTP